MATTYTADRLETLPERVERITRAWAQWSPAERRHLDDIVDEVIRHCADGTGNEFIAWWVRVVLTPALAREGAA